MHQSDVTKFYDVKAGGGDMAWTVFRFPDTEKGRSRANEYAIAYNASLRVAMGLVESDLELKSPDYENRPDEYDTALKVESYRSHCAVIRETHTPPVVGDDDPLPETYPHDF